MRDSLSQGRFKKGAFSGQGAASLPPIWVVSVCPMDSLGGVEGLHNVAIRATVIISALPNSLPIHFLANMYKSL